MGTINWFHDILIAVIVSGIPVTILGRPIWRTHRQTKTSNGTTLAHLVEKQGAVLGTLLDDQRTMKGDIADLAKYIGYSERHGDATVTPISRRLP